MTVRAPGLMLRAGTRCVLLCAMAVFMVSRSVDAVTSAGPASERRVELIRELIRAYFENQDLETPEYRVARAIEDAVRKLDESVPEGRPAAKPVTVEACDEAAGRTADDLVEKRYPPLDREALAAEAAELYPIYERGQVVTVTYMANPVRPTTVRDVYRDRTATALQVGRHVIYLPDMLAVKDNDKEVLKFDAAASTELRRQYVEAKLNAYQDERDRYEEKVREFAQQAEYERGIRRNEELGYIFVAGAWLDVRQAVTRLVQSERAQIREERIAEAERLMAEKTAHIAASLPAQRLLLERATPSHFQDPDILLAGLQGKLLADAELKAKQDAEEAAAKAAAAEAAAEAEAAAAAAAARAERTEPQHTPQPEKVIEEPSFFSPTFIIVMIVVILAALAAGVFWFLKARQAASAQAQKFFKGRGKLQKDFWSMAESDPDKFKYVAYRFPSIEESRNALKHLSYISEVTGGDLKCVKDIMFGFYPHQEKFVSFVGGPELHYALWREASAIFPELPGAEYFRVSTAPDVNLEIPDIESLLRDENLQVSHVENREGEGDDYSRYFVYRAPNKQNAIEFLKRVSVNEAGVHVLVETPEGTWGKDENGIYQE